MCTESREIKLHALAQIRTSGTFVSVEKFILKLNKYTSKDCHLPSLSLCVSALDGDQLHVGNRLDSNEQEQQLIAEILVLRAFPLSLSRL